MPRKQRRIRKISKPAAHDVVLAAIESALPGYGGELSGVSGSLHYTLGSVNALCAVLGLMAIPQDHRRRVSDALTYFRGQLPRKRMFTEFRTVLGRASRAALRDHVSVAALPGVTA